MISVTLMAKRPEYDDWRIRNRFGKFGAGAQAAKDLKEARFKAGLAMTGWIAAEPLTEFRIVEEEVK